VLVFVSPQTEADLFSGWTPEDLVSITPNDPRADAMRELVSRLARHRPDAPYDVRIEVSDVDEMNAMALPGGLIVVTRGLLDSVESENELAFVIGHELGHFEQRDHLRILGRTVVLGILYGAIRSNSSAANLGLTAADLAALGFSRKQESTADEFGLELVQSEYGHVAESSRFFERVAEDSSLKRFAYLSTHPGADDRIAHVRDLAAHRGWPQAGTVTELPW
jgi:predicted Zn-dependent protease